MGEGYSGGGGGGDLIGWADVEKVGEVAHVKFEPYQRRLCQFEKIAVVFLRKIIHHESAISQIHPDV